MILEMGELPLVWMLIWGAKDLPPDHPCFTPAIA
jgi:hypothetical protein